MCGIVGYAGRLRAAPFLREGLCRLEYRGYDSWGVATRPQGAPYFSHVVGLGAPSKGLTAEVERSLEGEVGIGHTRWATHGEPSTRNAHPVAGGEKFDLPNAPLCYVAHNGIIENHKELRAYLESEEGFLFRTDTDTECIAHLLSRTMELAYPPEVLLDRTLEGLRGRYAFVAICEPFPDTLLVAVDGAPLLVTEEGFVASDVAALAGYAGRCYRLKDGQFAVIRAGQAPRVYEHGILPMPVDVRYHVPVPAALDGDKAGYPHYMLKEIHDQGRLAEVGTSDLPRDPRHMGRLVLFGCGSSYNAALLGRHLFERVSQIPTQVEYATDMAEGAALAAGNEGPLSIDDSCTYYLALTQSGETRDTLDAMECLRREAADGRLFVLTNNPDSTAAGLGRVIPLGVGPEFGVAATKTFTAQVVRLFQLSGLWHRSYPSPRTGYLPRLAQAVASLLDREREVRDLANEVRRFHNVLFLGNGAFYPVAREGALKVKEVAYRHAESMPAAEMKHGPIALVDGDTLSVVLVSLSDGHRSGRILGNVQEIQARGGPVLAVADDRFLGASDLSHCDHVLKVPDAGDDLLQPLVHNIALQLLAYFLAEGDGLDVDRPRNLAKAVTVE